MSSVPFFCACRSAPAANERRERWGDRQGQTQCREQSAPRYESAPPTQLGPGNRVRFPCPCRTLSQMNDAIAEGSDRVGQSLAVGNINRPPIVLASGTRVGRCVRRTVPAWGRDSRTFSFHIWTRLTVSRAFWRATLSLRTISCRSHFCGRSVLLGLTAAATQNRGCWPSSATVHLIGPSRAAAPRDCLQAPTRRLLVQRSPRCQRV